MTDPFFKMLPEFVSAAEAARLLREPKNYAPPPSEWKYQQAVLVDREWARHQWELLKEHVPARHTGHPLVGLNDHYRYSKYTVGGHTPVHVDGVNQNDAKTHRAVLSLIIYLNVDFGGGGTTFFAKDGSERFSVHPTTPGDAIVFDGNQLHRGDVVVHGEKIVLRTDVMGLLSDWQCEDESDVQRHARTT
jgi:hypothetical protein